ncbi:uncharacterized protein CMU_023070 [Cryptosporidium muris RN66]|uniref:Uncharacterized protein n=1 Tax=Cryptosporidium muris (strain RN66) TaxID=441375 RepID=B6ABU9_CRYMR|nr:uncharacterized protein CMU_023070 [Cryptosporidium muris RN66]EEA05302.1 hypothetical protein CMU_023070 [Cryptosporidium muris RN66]|eukprot:XP_002139651.1 hypothetical protein [Cryptosporidium muris RN66]
MNLVDIFDIFDKGASFKSIDLLRAGIQDETKELCILYSQDGMDSSYSKANREYIEQKDVILSKEFLNRLIYTLNGSPHRLRMLISGLLELITESQKFDKFGISKKQLLPDPYLVQYKEYLKWYKLLQYCNNMTILNWIEILEDLQQFVKLFNDNRYKINLKSSHYKISILEKSSVSDWMLNLLKQPKDICQVISEMNMLQHSITADHVKNTTLWFQGLTLLKNHKYKSIGERFIRNVLKSITKTDQKVGVISSTSDSISPSLNYWMQVYCYITLSLSEQIVSLALKYIQHAYRIINNVPNLYQKKTDIKLYTFTMLCQLHLIVKLIVRHGRRIVDCSLGFNKSANHDTSLCSIVQSIIQRILALVLHSLSILSFDDIISIYNCLTQHITFILKNCPCILATRAVENIWYHSIERMHTLHIQEQSIILPDEKLRDTELTLLPPIEDVFLYLSGNTLSSNEEEEYWFHHNICWNIIIPTLMLKYTKGSGMSSSCPSYLAQLIDPLKKYMYRCNIAVTNNRNCVLLGKEISELHLFLALYTYYGLSDTFKTQKHITYGLKRLKNCSDCFDVCSLECIFEYLKLLVLLSDGNDDEALVEKILQSIINSGEKAFSFASFKNTNLKIKKLINFTLVQSYTLLAFIKKDSYRSCTEELKLHINSEMLNKDDSESSGEFTESNRTMQLYKKLTNKLMKSYNISKEGSNICNKMHIYPLEIEQKYHHFLN